MTAKSVLLRPQSRPVPRARAPTYPLAMPLTTSKYYSVLQRYLIHILTVIQFFTYYKFVKEL